MTLTVLLVYLYLCSTKLNFSLQNTPCWILFNLLYHILFYWSNKVIFIWKTFSYLFLHLVLYERTSRNRSFPENDFRQLVSSDPLFRFSKMTFRCRWRRWLIRPFYFRISPRIFVKFEIAPVGYLLLSGPGGTDSWKKPAVVRFLCTFSSSELTRLNVPRP